MPSKLHCGKDYVVTVQIKYLHTHEYFQEKFPNRTSAQWIDNCKVLILEKNTSLRAQLAAVFSHELFPYKELYWVAQYSMVDEEGTAELVFGNELNYVRNGEGRRAGGSQAN